METPHPWANSRRTDRTDWMYLRKLELKDRTLDTDILLPEHRLDSLVDPSCLYVVIVSAKREGYDFPLPYHRSLPLLLAIVPVRYISLDTDLMAGTPDFLEMASHPPGPLLDSGISPLPRFGHIYPLVVSASPDFGIVMELVCTMAFSSGHYEPLNGILGCC